MSIYEITVEDTQNKKVLLEAYKGKTLLIVNTATNCIFTPQYKILEAQYQDLLMRYAPMNRRLPWMGNGPKRSSTCSRRRQA
jgi:hypothetical protein